MDMTRDRADFGARQAEMTARWFDNVKRRHGDVDAYITLRQDAYLDRWQEAARFIADGARVLDIGGGNLYPRLIEFFRRRGFRYSYLDVDPGSVAGSEALARSLGLAQATFQHGFNDALYPADQSIDAVFSSHCIEHSIDLARTMAEVNRVLVPGGMLLMAVPFGWESNPEHPYFFAPDDWISILTDAGFEVRVAQVGREYPEHGYDFFIAARKVGMPGTARIDPRRYMKDSYRFLPADDPAISYTGGVAHEDFVLLDGTDWTVTIRVPSSAGEVLPILNRHDWSGVVAARWGSQEVSQDLHSWFSYVQPIRIAGNGAIDGEVTLSCAGANPNSHASQCVIYGCMIGNRA